MTQLEIEIPIQPPRVTLHRARALRDELEQRLKERNDRALINNHNSVATGITAIAMQFPRADVIFHTLHSGWDLEKSLPVNFVGKRALEQLREVGAFIAALESKSGPLNHSTPQPLNHHAH
jgi:hypothetical protein